VPACVCVSTQRQHRSHNHRAHLACELISRVTGRCDVVARDKRSIASVRVIALVVAVARLVRRQCKRRVRFRWLLTTVCAITRRTHKNTHAPPSSYRCAASSSSAEVVLAPTTYTRAKRYQHDRYRDNCLTTDRRCGYTASFGTATSRFIVDKLTTHITTTDHITHSNAQARVVCVVPACSPALRALHSTPSSCWPR
jgi:hypothetical protein